MRQRQILMSLTYRISSDDKFRKKLEVIKHPSGESYSVIVRENCLEDIIPLLKFLNAKRLE